MGLPDGLRGVASIALQIVVVGVALAACNKTTTVTATGAPAEGAGGAAGGPVGGKLGVACVGDADCGGDVCLYGFCRTRCESDLECDGATCLRGKAESGGCSLSSETCPSGKCDNAQLVCGLDKRCRVGCESECTAAGQTCVRGACVQAADAAFDCGAGVGEGQLSCDGKGQLEVCNTLGPGLAAVPGALCATKGLCDKTVLESKGPFTAQSLPACLAPVCEGGKLFCDGVKLFRCNEAGAGPASTAPIDTCASGALCKATIEADAGASACKASACPTPASQTACRAAQVEVVAQTCNAAQTAFDEVPCEGGTPHCNPRLGSCVKLVIDPTEVTRAAYQSFVDKPESYPVLPKACDVKAKLPSAERHAPDAAMLAEACSSGCDDHPVVGVDWCDAFAFCKAQGKRLCGRIDNGSWLSPQAEVAGERPWHDAGNSEWTNACSAGGSYRYATSDTALPNQGTCVYGGAASEAVTYGACVSPSNAYKAASHLIGNVAELENNCDKGEDAGSADDSCSARGGSFKSDGASLGCDVRVTLRRAERRADVGFRCCGP